jgi:hypothetical protein
MAVAVQSSCGSQPIDTAKSMLTGELRSQVDGIWNDFWSGALPIRFESSSRSPI